MFTLLPNENIQSQIKAKARDYEIFYCAAFSLKAEKSRNFFLSFFFCQLHRRKNFDYVSFSRERLPPL